MLFPAPPPETWPEPTDDLNPYLDAVQFVNPGSEGEASQRNFGLGGCESAAGAGNSKDWIPASILIHQLDEAHGCQSCYVSFEKSTVGKLYGLLTEKK